MSSPSTTSTDLVPQSAAVEAIMRAQEQQDTGDIRFRTPILKLTQGLTKEVKEGNAEAGEFLNTLTGESLGNKVEIVVAFYQPGRSASGKDGRYYVSVDEPNIPESWKDLVGEEWVGTPFAEYPDAEEVYKKRANAGEIEWGKGPQVSTTYNYTCLVRNPDDPDAEPMPVRISFLRTTKSAHEKIQMLKGSLLRNKPFWNIAFELSTQEKEFGRNSAFIVNVRSAGPATPDEQQSAVELATAVLGGQVEAQGDGGDAEVREERPKGALAV